MANLTKYEQNITGMILGRVDPKYVKNAQSALAAHACEAAQLEKEYPNSFKGRSDQTPIHTLPGLPTEKAKRLKELWDEQAGSFMALHDAVEKSARDIGMAGKRDPNGSNTPFETLTTVQVTQNLGAAGCTLKSKPIHGVGPEQEATAKPKHNMQPSV